MSKEELTTGEAAVRLGESDRLVRLWCKQGRFPNARLVSHPRGDYWTIPVGDLKTFVKPKPGPAPKPKTNDAPASKKKGSLPATPKFGSIELQTKTTRKLDQTVKRAAEKEMGGRKKGGKR
jgi:hypothetical protein